MEVKVGARVLGANEAVARENRQRLAARGIYCINIISSPGAGKTTILEKTVEILKHKLRLAVIEGDITTTLDADRISAHHVAVHQINTFGGCHLDARMTQRALDQFDLSNLDLLIVENVGNLICPADFELGEDAKVVVLSVPEGDDKPVKYPGIFQRARVLLLNKVDLLQHSNFDQAKMRQDLKRLNPDLVIHETVATTGQGLNPWCDWLVEQAKAKKAAMLQDEAK